MSEKVQDWMTKNVVTVQPETSLPEADELMREHKIRRLPVVDSSGKLVGIVTKGDVREAKPSQATSLSIWELNYLIGKLKVKDFMTKTVVTVPAGASLGEVANLMLKYKISGIPVVDQVGHLVGMVTESDLFRMMVRQEWAEEKATLA
jgi:CBS domain-containing protein